MSKIRVLIIEPNKEPFVKKIENTLDNLQSIVGGLIYFYDIEHNIDLIWNEESKELNLPFNRIIPNDIIVGTFIIAGQHNGATISLSRKQIKKYKEVFRLSKSKEVIEFVKGAIGNSSNLIRYDVRGIEKIIKFKI